MPININGTTGISGADGSAATPSIQGADTNTGIFFPAADTVAVSTGGSERMRIDTSGNVGIGTAVAGSVSTVLRLGNSGSGGGVVTATLSLGSYGTGYGSNIISGSDLNSSTASYLAFGTTPAGASGLSAPVERMRIDSSGNVGIGTSSPATALQVGSTSKTGDSTMYAATGNGAYKSGLVYEVSGQNAGFIGFNKTGSAYLGIPDSTAGFSTTSSIPLVFATQGTERARIDSSGNVLVAKTATTLTTRGSYLEAVTGAFISSQPSGGSSAAFFATSTGNQIGGIGHTATTTSYTTSSDYRLKHDIAPMQNALAKVAALKPVTYKWNVDDSHGEGFIAHELAEVVPQCVTGEKDAVDADGNPVYQGIDTSFLVATLTAAIQELKAIVDAQAVEIAALKGAA